MAEPIPADEQSNYETFRDCLSEPVLKVLAMPAEKANPKKKRHVKKGSKEKNCVKVAEIKSSISHREAQASDAEELGEFIEYLSSVVFPSLPPELRALTYPKYRDSVPLQDSYSTPLSASTYTHLLEIISPDAIDSLESYGLLPPSSDTTDQRNLLLPVLNAYATAVTAPPPIWTTTRTTECELCQRDWVPLTYHHLIPKSTHSRVLKRGWHDEDKLNSVAWLCRACHSFVHRLASNEELAKWYYTVDLITEGGTDGDPDKKDEVLAWTQSFAEEQREAIKLAMRVYLWHRTRFGSAPPIPTRSSHPPNATTSDSSDGSDEMKKLTISTGPKLPVPAADTGHTSGIAATATSPEASASMGAIRGIGMSPLQQFPTSKFDFSAAATSNLFQFGPQDNGGAPQHKVSEPARVKLNRRRRVHASSVRVNDTQAINLGPSIVSVQIGEGDTEQTHMIHEALLGDRSKSLQSILSEMHSQDSHKIVAFKDVDPKAFALYIQYLYTGNIPSKPSQKTAAGVDEYSMLCNLYVFAFQHEDVAAQNAACDAIHTKAYKLITPPEEALPRNEHIRTIYGGTTEPCAARRLLVDVQASQANRIWMSDRRNDLPPQFACDLALKLMDYRSLMHAQNAIPKEHYHVVASEELMFET